MSENLILVVDDEVQIQRFLRIALESSGYQVQLACTGGEGLEQAALLQPALIILDLGLPELSGLEVLTQLRTWSSIPVIVLSVRDQERDKVKALDLGADDYLTKPFGIQELLARIRVALRHAAGRGGTDESQLLENGPLKVDVLARRVCCRGSEVKLTKTEFNLLALLVQHAGKVLTHRQILVQIWGAEYGSETHYLQVYISQLRRKLEQEPTQPELILTEPGVGYRLQAF